MAFYPEVSAARQLLAWPVAIAIAVPAGFGFAWLLRPLREAGRVRRFVADLWAGWLAACLGSSIAGARAGPHLSSYSGRGGWPAYDDEPYSRGLGMVACIPIAVLI